MPLEALEYLLPQPVVKPFASQSQRRYLYAHDPEMAARWQAETPAGPLPERVRKADGPFHALLVRTLLARKDDPRDRKLEDLERRVVEALLLAWGTARTRLLTAAGRYLRDRPGAVTEHDLTNLLTMAARALADPDGGFLGTALAVLPPFAAAAYGANRWRGADAAPDARDGALADALRTELETALEELYSKAVLPALLAAFYAVLARGGDRDSTVTALEAALETRTALGESALTPGAKSKPEDRLWLLAALALFRGAALGSIVRGAAAGAGFYQLVATLDERTSTICRFLDGRVFPLSAGLTAADGYARGGGGPAWRSADELTALAGEGNRADPAANAGLAEAGVLLPPFHGHCRTVCEIL